MLLKLTVIASQDSSVVCCVGMGLENNGWKDNNKIIAVHSFCKYIKI